MHIVAVNPEKYQRASERPYVVEKLTDPNYTTRVDTGCLVWTKAISSTGYGVTSNAGLNLSVHRLAYWVNYGPVEGDLVVDHVCRNRACCEPAHLRLLTRAENTADSHTAHKTHCSHGHERTEENVYVWFDRKGNIHRQCRICATEKSKRWNRIRTERRRAARAAAAVAS